MASFSALLVAVLDDGRRLTLLDDRGWTVGGPGDVWQHMSATTVAATARTVVGPDEPFGDQTAQDAEADHWEGLAGVLGRQGVRTAARELSDLPHDVELSGRLLARLNGP
ncbi:hypothetical protein SAMN05216184_10181 [Georgenia satyanarayanai]|uniref:Uncharacterized protein n=1 Tax=Georgenia satyanarayanai TaxID=860221 RepID=A0A2Y9BUX9_9MICO|nr:hypothetical protein [Georgenia satyanarayanai]PYG01622.1 hypothetical protein A8987_10181 [Georgenia satyanarayanai]SSA36422.1 hypothetical protein SAMN05216184_10181 [Georgenia satyanarayanai]